MTTAAEALDRLVAGNQRFVAGRRGDGAATGSARRDQLVAGQKPFAVILGCSDSRVPAEIVFDQGLGDLFVIRIAGNIVAPSQIGSIEFAAGQFGTPLVVVLGHTQCGAVDATLEQVARPVEQQSPNLHAIVERIRPSVEPLIGAHEGDALRREAVRANIHASVRALQHGSEILEGLVRDGQLRIVGAEYSLETGVVEILDDD